MQLPSPGRRAVLDSSGREHLAMTYWRQMGYFHRYLDAPSGRDDSSCDEIRRTTKFISIRPRPTIPFDTKSNTLKTGNTCLVACSTRSCTGGAELAKGPQNEWEKFC